MLPKYLSGSALLIGAALPLTTLTAQTTVGGAITTSTTWTLAGSPYLVASAISVDNGATLTIDPGVEVRFQGFYGMTIGGGTGTAALLARGTASAPIRFTSASGIPGSWTGIMFGLGTADAVADPANRYLSGSILEHCDIAYAGTGTRAAITCAPGTPFIASCSLHDSNVGGVLLAAPRSLAVVRDSALYSLSGYGICHAGTTADGGIRLLDNAIHHVAGTGVVMSLSFHSSVPGMWIAGNTVTNCSQGIALRYGGTQDGPSQISNNTVSDCATTGIEFSGDGYSGQIFRFLGNRVFRCQTGMRIAANGSYIQTSVESCTLMHNTVQGLGFTFTNFATIKVIDCVIGRNGQSGDGGGLAAYTNVPPQAIAILSPFQRNRVFENRGRFGGGAYLIGCLAIDACEFVGNSAVDGGAIFISNNSHHTRVTNSHFLGNRATRGDDAFVDLPASVTITTNACSFAGPSLPTNPNQVWDGNDNPALGRLFLSGNVTRDPFGTVGLGLGGAAGIPTLLGSGPLTPGSTALFDLTNATPNAAGLLGLGGATSYQIALGGVVIPDLTAAFIAIPFVISGTGTTRVSVPNLPSLAPWSQVCAQAFFFDASAPESVAMSAGVLGFAR